VCDTIDQPHACVQCLVDDDCPDLTTVCDPTQYLCVSDVYMPDGGTPALPDDGGIGGSTAPSGGCGCRFAGGDMGSSAWASVVLLMMLLFRRRLRERSRS
jgi:MYXO-CTERM domain-containing protein